MGWILISFILSMIILIMTKSLHLVKMMMIPTMSVTGEMITQMKKNLKIGIQLINFKIIVNNLMINLK